MCNWPFTFILLFIFVQSGSCLMCYECTTIFGDEECGEDFEPEDIDKVECDGTDICMIHVSPEISSFPEITQRGCVDRFFCNKIDEWNEHCITCDEDLCNISSKLIASTSLIIITVFANGFFQKFL
ncbi:hypothetical protein ILUMI_20299 [Ignelater luminosus]|uniref:Protein quiver n=1 Tax=Ignelater luminosus TaxID=2038154 RepID=A0A8K0CKW7_IGNLU|nr:hypothetical protein ILUMI_20299 [Ignelater luminosus]